ncbi:MAG: HlyD family secretion protein [Stellaceae bacterium]
MPDTRAAPGIGPGSMPAPIPPRDVPPPPVRQRRWREHAVRIAVLAAAGAVVVLFATQWDRWVGGSTRQVTDDAYIQSDITPLSAKVAGYVREVAVDDFDRVKAGQLLVRIEADDFRARVAQAEAELAGAEAAIQNLKSRKQAQHAAVAEAGDAVAATEADVVRTRQEAVRQQKLLATGFGTQQVVEQADAAARRFAATLASTQAALAKEQRQMAVLDTEESELRAAAKAKQASLDLAKINLGYTTIVAPVDGMVSERRVYRGQYVHEGAEVISVVPLADVWVIANYKETQLTRVAIGQRAELRVDTFPGHVIGAMVESISPASGSQFSLLPPDNATGNFTKVVQRIPVKLRINPDNPLAGHLLPGMSVEATILTDTTPPPP